MGERRRFQVLHLGALVPAAESHRLRRAGLRDEFLRLFVGERAALQFEAADRARRQLAEIVFFRRAKETLRIDMQRHRSDDVFAEPFAQQLLAEVLVPVVDAAFGGDAELVDQMADIVQQGGGDEGRTGIFLFRLPGTLQRVFELVALPRGRGQVARHLAG